MTVRDREHLVVFGTMFRVMRADQLLAQQDIPHGLSPTPAGITSPCGTCVRFQEKHLQAVLDAVGEAGLEWQGIYRSSEADGWQRLEHAPDF